MGAAGFIFMVEPFVEVDAVRWTATWTGLVGGVGWTNVGGDAG